MTGEHETARRAVGLSLKATICSLLLVLMTLPGVAPVGAQDSEGSVQVEVSAGFDGAVGAADTFPVTIALTAERARDVEVDLVVEGERRTYAVELVAGAAVELAVAASAPPFGLTSFRIVADVRDGGQRLGSGDTEVVPEPGRMLVGVGASMPVPADGAVRQTLGGVQEAQLVRVDDDLASRPGALEALSTVVLGPADVDALDDATRDALRRWVWRGGELVVDRARTDPLPVLELPAATGGRTAVGGGWVRFSDGRAAGGAWDSVLEPAVARQPTEQVDAFMGMVDQDRLELLELIDVEFLPVPVVLLGVFGTALLVGPGLWALLRTRSRRRWMWVASPVLSLGIAGAILVVGQGVFTSAEARASASLEVDPWGSQGEVVFGLKQSTSITVPPRVEVVGASPAAVVEDLGEGRRLGVDLPRNGFGYLGVSPVPVGDEPMLEVSAVAGGEDEVEVTVTNRSGRDLVDVQVRSATRSRPFDDVPAGASVTLPFLVGAEIGPFSPMFPMDPAPQFGWDPVAPPGGPLPLSRGLVVVSGRTRGAVEAAGLSADGELTLQAMAPVTGEGAGHTTLRIESVGEVPRPGDGLQPEQEQDRRFHLRIVAPDGRAAAPCGVHTVVGGVEHWNGSAWVEAPTVGEPYDTPRFLAPNEVQARQLPAIEPGGALHLRLTSRVFLEAPLLIDCGERT